MQLIPFYKMSGSGNDFIIIDNRDQVMAGIDLARFIQRVCQRRMSVGADGLILIEDSQTADFKWHFYNSDGGRAEMCGNGARCAARFAFLKGIAGAQMAFETDIGIITAEVRGRRVKVKLQDPSDMRLDFALNLKSGALTVNSINTGVPHVVIFYESLEDVDVHKLGREIRFHSDFVPAGTNVNFISLGKDGGVAIRTYERGVEAETLACGTGSTAAALIAAAKKGIPPPVSVRTRSGEILRIYFKAEAKRFSDIYLDGDTWLVYTAELGEDAFNGV